MTNDYLLEATVRLKGVRQHRGLRKRLRSIGFIETKAPENTPEKMYEFYPYRIVCYHPVAEDVVKKFLDDEKIKFKIKHKPSQP